MEHKPHPVRAEPGFPDRPELVEGQAQDGRKFNQTKHKPHPVRAEPVEALPPVRGHFDKLSANGVLFVFLDIQMEHTPAPFGLSSYSPTVLSLPFDRLRTIGNTNARHTNHTPFGLSLPFDRLRTVGNSMKRNTNPTPFGLSLSKPYLRLRGTSAGSVPSTSSGCTGTSTGSVRTGVFLRLEDREA
jgi:hypothetical protein